MITSFGYLFTARVPSYLATTVVLYRRAVLNHVRVVWPDKMVGKRQKTTVSPRYKRTISE